MSHDPYKSRLFNFINRQTIRFQDKLGITIRQLRSATEMGVQLLLYPAYLMVQAGRVTRQQLEAKVQSSLLLSAKEESESNSASASNSVPLDEVLNLVEPWLEARENSDRTFAETIDVSPNNETRDFVDPWLNFSPETNATPSEVKEIQPSFAPIPAQASLKIQGIASVLDSHQLVLVSPENRILNVLDQKQQKLLQQYLVKRQQQPNLLITTTRKVLASLPTISKQSDSIPSPVKLFWQMLEWVQTSSVATTVNLFGESQLVSSTPVLPSNTTSSALPNALIHLENTVTDLETSPFVPNSMTIGSLGDRVSRLSPQANLSGLTESQPNIPANPFQIRAIIKAAIDYFYGRIRGNSVTTLPTSARRIPLESKNISSYLPGKSLELNLPQAEDSSSWLSWNDIFSNTITSTVQPRSSEQQKGSIEASQSASLSANTANPLPSFPTSQEHDEVFTDITYSSSPDTQLETASDLLETEATTVGYVKHPLERILGILDYLIVWLEETFLKIWQLFKDNK